MRLSVRHHTRYDYTLPPDRALQRLRLRPKGSHGQRVVEWNVTLDGLKLEATYEDHNANAVMLVSHLPGAAVATIESAGLVETSDMVGVVGSHLGPLPLWHFLKATPLTRPGRHVAALVARAAVDMSEGVTALHRLSAAVRESVDYQTGQTDSATTAEVAIEHGAGVCQDHAHIFCAAARRIGVPARYVSGYLMLDDRIDQEAGHAWAEAHVDGLGWVGFDVSNQISPDARYVRVATGSDYSQAAPVTGISFGAGLGELTVSLAVEQQAVQQ